METLKFIEQENLVRKKEIIKEILLALFLGISNFLCFRDMFQLKLCFSEPYLGGMRSGLVYTWNQIADVLGSENYILLPKFTGEGEGNTIFLIGVLILFVILYFFFVHSKNRWAIFLFFFLTAILSGVTNLQISMMTMVLFGISVIGGILHIRDSNGLGNKVFLFILTAILCLVIFSSPLGRKLIAKSETIHEVQNVVKTKLKDQYYGLNLLKNGDLKQRKREKDKEDALEITMTTPQSIYLRGFVGESYQDSRWEALPNYNYYKEKDFFYWLKKERFQAFGQLGQAEKLFQKEEAEENHVSIQVKKADSRYAYIPYEITGEFPEGKEWGGSFITPSGLNRLKTYSYDIGNNAVKTWTDTAAKVFLGADTENVKDYLRKESNYNAYVYQNFTYLSKKEKSILNRYIGKAGDQSQGHIDYKPAIAGIQKYLEDNFIYTENLGEKAEKGQSMLEEFLESKKGYDVQFATAATLMFRYYGIPARYVEGYLVTPEDAKKMESGKPEIIPKSNAHAWVEIYVDGTGFVPIEVSPPYRKIMEEADMEVGISNNTLLRPFDSESGANNKAQKTEMSGDDNTHITFPIIIIICGVIGLIILTILIRMLWKYFFCLKNFLKRWNLFHWTTPKLAVSAMYSYMEEQKYRIEESVRELGNKAAYSLEEVGEKERKEMLMALKNAAKEKKKNEKKNKRSVGWFSCGGTGIMRLRNRKSVR